MLIKRFQEAYRDVKEEDENGKVITRTVRDDIVTLSPGGASSLTCDTNYRISRIHPENVREDRRDSESYQAIVARWEAIGGPYEAWKQTSEIPADGMPLAAWAAVSKTVVEALKPYGIVTVEGVRDMPADMIEHIPHPNAKRLPALAAEYLEGRDVTNLQEERDDLRDRIAQLEEMLTERSNDTPRKRGPGRPRKEDINGEGEAA